MKLKKLMHQLLENKFYCLLGIAALGVVAFRNWPPQVTAQAPKTIKGGWRLVWHDEFDEDGSLDSEKWDFEKGFVRNYEEQWYTPENAFQRDGKKEIDVDYRQVAPMYVAEATLTQEKATVRLSTTQDVTDNDRDTHVVTGATIVLSWQGEEMGKFTYTKNGIYTANLTGAAPD